jgi:predicted methyltransferase
MWTNALGWTAIVATAAGCAGAKTAARAPATEPPPVYAAMVAAPDRLEPDRALDAGRHPAEMLAFLGIRPGMRVAELGAGGGYTTELLARAAAPTGVVYAQNSKTLLGFVGDAWATRLERPAMRHVVRVDREFDDPLPPEATRLDLVVINAVYHDTVWMKADRARMDRAVFDALAPGGAFVVIDSSARPGTGVSDSPTLHRIDEQAVRDEVQAAGFRLAGTGDFLRNPDDTRDWNSSPRAAGSRRGTSDRFALRFVKP